MSAISTPVSAPVSAGSDSAAALGLAQLSISDPVTPVKVKAVVAPVNTPLLDVEPTPSPQPQPVTVSEVVNTIATASVESTMNEMKRSASHRGHVKGILKSYVLVEVPGVGDVRVMASEWHTTLFNPFLVALGDPILVSVYRHEFQVLREQKYVYGFSAVADSTRKNELIDADQTLSGVVDEVFTDRMEANVSLFNSERVCKINSRLLSFLLSCGLQRGDCIQFKVLKDSDLVCWVSPRVEREHILSESPAMNLVEPPRIVRVVNASTNLVTVFNQMSDKYMNDLATRQRDIDVTTLRTCITCWTNQIHHYIRPLYLQKRITMEEYIRDRFNLLKSILLSMISIAITERSVPLHVAHADAVKQAAAALEEMHQDTGVRIEELGVQLHTLIVNHVAPPPESSQ
jgi:hypothetical protein